ncbi:hypothetical protein CHCC5022_1870 [Bacillus paralicheniformis]|nr:hypothetical protein CHCC5022_1870 [Bacillus paralicheniformis]TWN32430.1 hypothetical protein CHCC14527_2194 [Bacillus paralicheniformis]
MIREIQQERFEKRSRKPLLTISGKSNASKTDDPSIPYG